MPQPWTVRLILHAAALAAASPCVDCVHYCSTYYKAICAGGLVRALRSAHHSCWTLGDRVPFINKDFFTLCRGGFGLVPDSKFLPPVPLTQVEKKMRVLARHRRARGVGFADDS